MAIGLVGRKSGMTRIFNDEGVSVPVTVIEVEPNRVTRVKTSDSDGYRAIQITAGAVKPSKVNKAAAGQFVASGVDAGQDAPEVGAELSVSAFEAGQLVDVTGQSKGKGFQGGVKRWNFHMQDATHGNSISHRAPGSIGQCQTPGRVFKGKKMAGHMGAARVTTQSLEVVRVDAERGLIMVKGAVPGAPGGDVVVRPAVKVKNS